MWPLTYCSIHLVACLPAYLSTRLPAYPPACLLHAIPCFQVQIVSMNASSAQISGTFCLAFAGYATSAIPYDAAASRLESALESLASVGNVQVRPLPWPPLVSSPG